MKQFCYVVLDSEGNSRALKDGDADTEETGVLPRLLRDGWKPVRETPLGGGARLTFSLILLQKTVKKRGNQ